MGCQAGVEPANLTTVMITDKTTTTKSYDTIKLGIDAHAKWYYVARQLDGATPQPVQKMDLDGLLHFVAKQQRLAREVHTCYEAGAFGLLPAPQAGNCFLTVWPMEPRRPGLEGVGNDAVHLQDGVLITETPGSPTDTVEVKIPKSLASPGTSLFARLNVVVTMP